MVAVKKSVCLTGRKQDVSVIMHVLQRTGNLAEVSDLSSWSPGGSFMVQKMAIIPLSPSFKG